MTNQTKTIDIDTANRMIRLNMNSTSNKVSSLQLALASTFRCLVMALSSTSPPKDHERAKVSHMKYFYWKMIQLPMLNKYEIVIHGAQLILRLIFATSD